MGDFSVFQRTEDGMFDATALMRQWNSVEGNSKKEMKRFLEADSTKRFIQSLVREEKSKSQKCDFDENQGVKIIKEVKGRAKQGGGRTPDTVWMHPLLFIKFAMHLNPEFEVKVLKFVYDQLIDYRIKLGDRYQSFSAAGAKIGCKTPDDFKILARCLNCAILGQERQREQRNELTVEEAKELDNLQEKFIMLVNDGYITDMEGMKTFFRKRYIEKFWKNVPFQEV